MARQCDTGMEWRDGYCKRNNDSPPNFVCNVNPLTEKKRTWDWCKKHNDNCSWVGGGCQKSRSSPEQSYELVQTEQKIEDMFNKAGIVVSSGEGAKRLNKTNCNALGKWMLENVNSWNTDGKNPKIEGRSLIASMKSKSGITDTQKEKIQECAQVVGEKLKELPPTPRI